MVAMDTQPLMMLELYLFNNVFMLRTRSEKVPEVKPALTKSQKQPASAAAAAESEAVDKQSNAVTMTTTTKTTKVKQEQSKKAAKSQSL